MKTQKTDSDKVTLRFWKGRLIAWPGSVQRWIEKNAIGELVVDKFPGVGHVTPTRLEYGSAMHAINSMPANISGLLTQGFPVVVKRAELPKFTACLI